MPPPGRIEVVAPNLKRRLSGVTATVVRLVPVQARMIGIVTTGPGLPAGLPHIPLWRAATLPRDRWRVWHARRNTEMALGLLLRGLLGRRYRLLFTSAAQRAHTGLTRWLIRRQDAVIATSPQAAAYLERPATVILHGVDTQVFRPPATPEARADLRRELGLDPDAVLIGCFGRVRAQKGVDLLVESALALFPAHPRATLILTGRVTADNRAFADALAARAAAAGLSSRIRFLGELPWERLVRHYQALDLFAAPARWEGFGLTPLEAMACGVPVVASRAGAYETLIRDGVTGSLVERGDGAALTAALDRWLSDPAGRALAGRAARAHVEQNHAIESEARAITAVYRRLLGVGTGAEVAEGQAGAEPDEARAGMPRTGPQGGEGCGPGSQYPERLESDGATRQGPTIQASESRGFGSERPARGAARARPAPAADAGAQGTDGAGRDHTASHPVRPDAAEPLGPAQGAGTRQSGAETTETGSSGGRPGAAAESQPLPEAPPPSGPGLRPPHGREVAAAPGSAPPGGAP